MSLLDILQGTSNSVASNVSAPVDGLAWLLRKLGAPVPANPMGGSDWMAQKGLTRDPQNRNDGLLGEFLGMTGPMVAAAKAPQVARGLLQMGDNAMAPRTMNPQTGAVVWHGSPHKFDKFDSGKIGTGEGAQAYGHGLYLAESPAVAGQYSQVLSDTAKLTPQGRAARALSENGDDLIAAKQSIYRDYNAATSPAMQNAAMKAIDVLQSGKVKAPQLYKVDLPDEHIAKMLDWDKPLSQQHPDVQKAADKLAGNRLNQLFESQKRYGITNKYDTLTGEELLRGMGSGGAGESALKAQGIPGIRYLDGGSRGAGTGSSNFVVFPGNEGLLNILERNGQKLK